MKQIYFRGDEDTLVKIVKRDNGLWSVLTAACNPKTGEKMQKFGNDPGNLTDCSLSHIIEELEKEYPDAPLIKVSGLVYHPLSIAYYLDAGRKYIIKYKRVYEVKSGPKGFYTSELKDMRRGKDDSNWTLKGRHLFTDGSHINRLKNLFINN